MMVAVAPPGRPDGGVSSLTTTSTSTETSVAVKQTIIRKPWRLADGGIDVTDLVFGAGDAAVQQPGVEERGAEVPKRVIEDSGVTAKHSATRRKPAMGNVLDKFRPGVEVKAQSAGSKDRQVRVGQPAPAKASTFSFDEIVMASRSMSSITTTTAIASSTNSITSPPNSVFDLPPIPSALIGLMVAAIISGFVLAGIFYAINFFSGGSEKREKYGYQILHQHDADADGMHASSSSTDQALREPRARRRPQHLGVDIARRSSDGEHGLGLNLHGFAPLSRRISLDEETLQEKPTSPAVTAWASALTAPLPLSPFRSSSSLSVNDLESGSPLLRRLLTAHNSSGASFPQISDSTSTSPYIIPTSPPSVPSPNRAYFEVKPSRKFLGKLEDWVGHVTWQVAKVFHDQVRDDPEENLLLPVKMSEREEWPPASEVGSRG